MAGQKCNSGLDDRCRDRDGSTRQKRGDTLVGTLRQIYGENFALGRRSDLRLDTLLQEQNAHSLTELLERRGK
jgi:hypothetical protein